jgi:hypothetical protein
VGRPHASKRRAAAGNAAGSHWNSFAKPALGQFEPMNLRAQASSGRSHAWHTPNDTARNGTVEGECLQGMAKRVRSCCTGSHALHSISVPPKGMDRVCAHPLWCLERHPLRRWGSRLPERSAQADGMRGPCPVPLAAIDYPTIAPSPTPHRAVAHPPGGCCTDQM